MSYQKNLTKYKPLIRIIMKKWMLLLSCLVALHFGAQAGNDKMITVNQLPAPSQQYLKQYFSADKVAYAKVDQDWLDKDYKVIFTNGNKVEFDKQGEWKEVDCKYTQLPTGIVPQAIVDYVKTNYPTATMLKIERDTRGYEVQLNNRLELTFNLQFQLMEID